MNYHEYHKSPGKRKAGPGFADPEFELPIEWLDTRERIEQAEREQKSATTQSRVLLVSGAARHDQTCSGEMSKTFRLAQMAGEEIERATYYATSHEALDRDMAMQDEVRNSARTLIEGVKLARAGQLPRPDRNVHSPRTKIDRGHI